MLPSSQWLPWALLSAAFAAATAVLAKLGVRDVDSDLATLLRTAVVIVALATLVITTGKWRNPASMDARTLWFLTASGLATGASWVCYFRALKLGEAAKVAPVDKLSVVLVALFAVAFLSEHLSGRGWLGISLVTIGVVLLAIPG
jgi:bacterial/archaeal transporter family protein